MIILIAIKCHSSTSHAIPFEILGAEWGKKYVGEGGDVPSKKCGGDGKN